MEIKLNDIRYKDIFDNLNVEINKNEVNAIIGKSSSGKTMLMNLVFGLVKDFDGEIKIGRKVINNKTKGKNILEIRKDIGYVRQDFENDLFNVNVFEDIKYRNSNVDMVRLNELLNSFGLDEKVLDKCYINLSSSEKKKILLIKLFLEDNKVIMIDDATNGLDSKSISNLIKILKREKRNDKIIIVSSIDSDFLLSIADSFIILDSGKVKRSSDKYSVFTDVALLNRLNIGVPNIVSFMAGANKKKIRLVYRDNINDLIKDIYRNAKK